MLIKWKRKMRKISSLAYGGPGGDRKNETIEIDQDRINPKAD